MLEGIYGNLVSSNVLTRTLFMRQGQNLGTGFTLDLESGHFLITAKHVLEQPETTQSIEVFHENQWRAVQVEPITVSDKDFDGIALKPRGRISHDLPLAHSCEMIVSQEVFFLGFPLGLFTDGSLHNNGFPIPFVKRATLSGLGGADNFPLLFLDGIGNPGFSGGPVVSLMHGSQNPAVIGVISDYKCHEVPIFYHERKLEMVHRENTGIITACGIKALIDAIASKTNPS